MILKYLKSLSKNDIKVFLNNKNIILNDNEIDYLVNYISSSNNLDINIIKENLKNNLETSSYEKLINLYEKNKYI